MIKIDKTSIAALNPCKDRFDNYVAKYGDRAFTPRQFMGLKHITHKDKMWVAFRVLSKESVVKAAADIAETVLHLYESKYPGDLRPRKAIEAARSGVEPRKAADASDASDAAASYAAYAAASDAAAADAAAAYAAASKGKSISREVQEKLNRTIILRYWK